MTLRRALLAFILCLSLPAAAEVSPPGHCGMDRFRITLIPKKDQQEQLLEFQPLVDRLADGLGVPVEILPASSYDSVIDAVTVGAADMAVMGPASYILARRRDPGIVPFASLAVEGGPFTPPGSSYYSLLIVHGNSDFATLEDLRGGHVGLGDPASTSGTLVPRVSFPVVAGSSLEEFFSTRVYTGGHDRAMDALLERRVDAAFVSSARVDEYVRRGRVAGDTFRVVWRSEPLHYDPFVFSSGLCQSARDRVTSLMFTVSPRLSRFLDNLSATAITPVAASDYRIVDKLIPAADSGAR